MIRRLYQVIMIRRLYQVSIVAMLKPVFSTAIQRPLLYVSLQHVLSLSLCNIAAYTIMHESRKKCTPALPYMFTSVAITFHQCYLIQKP